MSLNVPLIINGDHVTSNNTYSVKSPFNEALHDVTYLTDFQSTVPQICLSAQQGLEEWSAKGFLEKSAILSNAIEIVKLQQQELARGHREIGGPSWFSDLNVDLLIDQLQEYIRHLSAPEGIVPRTFTSDLALVIKQPIGPVLSISPWNAPVVLCGRSITAPLAAGCSVITKSHEKSPYINYLLVKILHEAGVPPKTIQLVNIRPQDNAEFLDVLLGTNIIRKVNFTGSTLVGRQIAKSCANHLIPYLLELGGKNTSIVEKDADIQKAAADIVRSSWAHKGQICMCLDRVHVHEEVYEQFKNELMKVASELSKDSDYSIPQRDETFTKKINDLVDDALNKGASILFGEIGSPMILEHITSSMEIDETESFGPLLSLHVYSDKEVLLKTLNSLPYGLKASIWSSNIINAVNIARKLQAGGVHINGSTIHDELTIPHGGVKNSGTGRFNGKWGIDEFSVIKSITINE